MESTFSRLMQDLNVRFTQSDIDDDDGSANFSKMSSDVECLFCDGNNSDNSTIVDTNESVSNCVPVAQSDAPTVSTLLTPPSPPPLPQRSKRSTARSPKIKSKRRRSPPPIPGAELTSAAGLTARRFSSPDIRIVRCWLQFIFIGLFLQLFWSFVRHCITANITGSVSNVASSNSGYCYRMIFLSVTFMQLAVVQYEIPFGRTRLWPQVWQGLQFSALKKEWKLCFCRGRNNGVIRQPKFSWKIVVKQSLLEGSRTDVVMCKNCDHTSCNCWGITDCTA